MGKGKACAAWRMFRSGNGIGFSEYFQKKKEMRSGIEKELRKEDKLLDTKKRTNGEEKGGRVSWRVPCCNLEKRGGSRGKGRE